MRLRPHDSVLNLNFLLIRSTNSSIGLWKRHVALTTHVALALIDIPSSPHTRGSIRSILQRISTTLEVPIMLLAVTKGTMRLGAPNDSASVAKYPPRKGTRTPQRSV